MIFKLKSEDLNVMWGMVETFLDMQHKLMTFCLYLIPPLS